MRRNEDALRNNRWEHKNSFRSIAKVYTEFYLNTIFNTLLKKSVCHNILLWVFFFFCLTLRTFAQPKADFTVNATHGCGSLAAYFTDASTGNPSTWFWNFGNGQTSIVQNPVIFYAAPGTYTVTLTVTNSLGNDNITKANYIVVDAAPVAQFYLDSGSGCLPFLTSFKDLSNPVSGTITNWSWDFGDGSVSNLQNPLHTYTMDSVYSVKLTVQNSKGCSDSLLLLDTVNVGSKPLPGFITNQLNVCASVGVNFNNKTTGNKRCFTVRCLLGFW